MTEHPRDRRRTRTPRGRHAAGPRPSQSPVPVPDDPAPRPVDRDVTDARARAFGDAAPAAATAAGEARGRETGRRARRDDGTEPETTRQLAPVAADPAAGNAARSEPAAPGPAAQERTAQRSAGSSSGRGRRRAVSSGGSLPRAAGWTLLTTLIPGTGLIPTRMRALGILLIAVLVLAAGALAAWFVLGDPIPTLLSLAVNRTFLLAALGGLVLAGLVWLVQILVSNLAHNTRQHLRGFRRAVSVLFALVLMVGAATPFAFGAQRIYAAQGLLGNTTVFSGKDDGRISAGANPWAKTPRLNVMLLGQDAGADRTGTRPDTIMFASIDTKTGRTALFSLPRNLQYVRFPAGSVEAQQFPEGFSAYGKDENLINAVWQWGDENKNLFPGDPNPGLTATRDAVEQTMGMKADYYAMVNLQGFQDLVNAIGGVDINVERKIPIGGGTNQATGGKYPITGWIQPGWQHLDGYQALWYARSREGSDDFNRMCRQQRMVRIVSQEANPAKLALAFPRLVTATEDNIVTDIPPNQLDAFVDLAQRVQKAGFQSYPVTHDVDAPGANTWNSGGHPDWDYLHQWVQSSIQDSMSSTTAQSVAGGPSDAASAPAATTAPPEASPTEETTEPSEEETTTSAAPAAQPTAAPADPLKSCLPASEQG